MNVVPCSVKKTTVTGCPYRSDTYCNGVTEEHVKLGSLVWLDHWIGGSAIYESEDNTHRGKATNKSHEIWMISMKNQTLHSAPYLAKSFGALHHKWPHKSLQSGSLMVLAVKPLKRELGLLQAWTSLWFHRAKNCLGIWMNKWSYMQKCLYSKQPQSKSKIVTIQVAGNKLQEISWNLQENQRRLFCRIVFLQEIAGGCRQTHQVYRNSLSSQPGRIMNVLFPLPF